jgi:hypothetical protein
MEEDKYEKVVRKRRKLERASRMVREQNRREKDAYRRLNLRLDGEEDEEETDEEEER